MVEHGIVGNTAHWWDENFPPGKENLAGHFKKGICPHFGRICQGATLIGKTRDELLKDPQFCGKWMAFNPHTEIPSRPNTACARVAKALGELIQLAEPTVKSPIKLRADGKVKIAIICEPDELDKNLYELIRRSTGQVSLERLTAGVKALEGEEASEKSPKEILYSAKKVFRKLCWKTLGAKNVEELIWHLVGHPPKGKGCKQRPENDHIWMRED